MHRRTLLAAALVAAAVAATPAAAQAPASAPAPAPADTGELTRIQQRLAQLQAQASADTAVKAAEARLDAFLLSAQDRLDPAAAGKRARATALKAEVDAARAASDNAKLNQLAAEAQALQAYFGELRQRVLAQADVQDQRKAYVSTLFAAMQKIDPQAPELVARLQAIRSGGAPAQ